MDEAVCVGVKSSDLTESFKAQARLELGETDKSIEDGLVTIREWIRDHNELASYKIGTKNLIFLGPIFLFTHSFHSLVDDLSIIWFLRACKYDIKRTKTRMTNFFTFRLQVPEWYGNRNPILPELKEILNLGYV